MCDDDCCSCGGVEGDWWTSEVCGWYCGTVEAIGEIGDFWTSNDVFELIDEVRDDGCCSCEGDWRTSDDTESVLVSNVVWLDDGIVGNVRSSEGVVENRWSSAICDWFSWSIGGVDEVGDFCVPPLVVEVRDDDCWDSNVRVGCSSVRTVSENPLEDFSVFCETVLVFILSCCCSWLDGIFFDTGSSIWTTASSLNGS